MKEIENLEQIRNLYNYFENNPEKLESKWITFFSDLEEEAKEYLKNKESKKYKENNLNNSYDKNNNDFTINSLRARLLIRAYRIAGHLKADLDPLGLMDKNYIPDLDPETYGFDLKDLKKEDFEDV